MQQDPEDAVVMLIQHQPGVYDLGSVSFTVSYSRLLSITSSPAHVAAHPCITLLPHLLESQEAGNG